MAIYRTAEKRRSKPGFTIPQTAKELNLDEQQVRRAVKNGEIKVVPFAGLDRVPPAEVERLKAELLINVEK